MSDDLLTPFSEAELEADSRISNRICKQWLIANQPQFAAEAYQWAEETVRSLLEKTADLTEVDPELFVGKKGTDLRRALRCLPAALKSEDTLKGQMEVASPWTRVNAPRAVAILLEEASSLFVPWLHEGRRPSEMERAMAVAALRTRLGDQRAQTLTRNRQSDRQEGACERLLLDLGYVKRGGETEPVRELTDLRSGEFCRKLKIDGFEADFAIALYSGGYLLIEAKVSNSDVNSHKRLGKEVQVKSDRWGQGSIWVGALLAGSFPIKLLAEVQAAGSNLVWEHDLDRLRPALMPPASAAA